MLATHIRTISTHSGTLSVRVIMQAAAAHAPIRICPSPPTFQKRILKAGVSASAMSRSTEVFWAVTQVLRLEPKAPLITAANTSRGFSRVRRIVTMLHRTSASKIAISLIPQTFSIERSSRLEIWKRGSLFFIFLCYLPGMSSSCRFPVCRRLFLPQFR